MSSLCKNGTLTLLMTLPPPMKASLQLGLLLALTTSAVRADIKLPALFSDGLVLQQGKPVAVWGWGAPDEDVSVRFAGQTQVTRVDLEGKWRVSFDPLPANAEPQETALRGPPPPPHVPLSSVCVCVCVSVL